MPAPGLETVAVASPTEALGALDASGFDLVVMDLWPTVPGHLEVAPEVVRQSGSRAIPVVLAALGQLPPDREEAIGRIATGTARLVRSRERLLDQIALLLHTPIDRMSERVRTIVVHLYATDAVLAGKKVLIVDDDVRNIFALTSVLERQKMEVLAAENGLAASPRELRLSEESSPLTLPAV